MNVAVSPDLVIDTTELTKQRDLIDILVTNLESGRTGIAIMSDLDALNGIQGILDAVADAALDCIDIDEGPDCPGCTNPGECDDCEYGDDPDVDPVCQDYIPPGDRR